MLALTPNIFSSEKGTYVNRPGSIEVVYHMSDALPKSNADGPAGGILPKFFSQGRVGVKKFISLVDLC